MNPSQTYHIPANYTDARLFGLFGIRNTADIAGYEQRMWELYEKETEASCRAMIEDNINEVRYLAANEAVTRRFFPIFRLPVYHGIRIHHDCRQRLAGSHHRGRRGYQRQLFSQQAAKGQNSVQHCQDHHD